MQNNWPSVLFAMAGGIFLSIGNLSTQYAWALVGLSVVEVVSASITVVIGIFLFSVNLTFSIYKFRPFTYMVCFQHLQAPHLTISWMTKLTRLTSYSRVSHAFWLLSFWDHLFTHRMPLITRKSLVIFQLVLKIRQQLIPKREKKVR